MSEEDAPPEPDRLPGAPHPRLTARLYGQEAAEAAFLDAWNAGRLHHAWLIRGPGGIGKATLAYRLARAVLAEPAASGGLFADAPAEAKTLDVDPDHPVARHVAAGSEPRLTIVRRGHDEKTKRLRTVIRVDEVRALKSHFQLTAADGGWRAAIIDVADEMNPNAANALLKLLEEPPPQALVLLVSHAPASLLPTIRSRCRTLDCRPLAADDLNAALTGAGFETPPESADAVAELAGGSAGRAISLLAGDGLAIYAQLCALMRSAPEMDRARLVSLADSMGGAANRTRFETTVELTFLLLSRLARHGAGWRAGADAAEGEAKMLARLAPGPAAARLWAEMAQRAAGRMAQASAVNLDPGQTILDTFLEIDAAAHKAARAAA